MKKKLKKRRKPQKDVNQMAFDVITKVQVSEHDAAKALGRKGGMARKAKLSLERLTEIGKQGAEARWNKHKKRPIAPISGNQ
ncbi:MAG: hypothetical protein WA718_10450 [Terriglobales bacterium]